MSSEGFKRKLTAVLSADVAGYSRLMSEDDEATIRTLNGHRKMMSTLINRHQGRVVDSPCDKLLAEFESVLQGVNCAVEIQRELAERNAELSEDRRMEYRIGVNIEDVIKEGDRIYGDGVNIAARLEALAEPGGICISSFVYNQVKNRSKLEYEYLGEQSVKNIKEPVPASQKALEKAGIAVSNLSAVKAHNPFSVNDIIMRKEEGIDDKIFNNYRSSLIFGHPWGLTVMRPAIGCIEELVIKGGGYGLVAGCAARDTGAALVIKVN